MSVERDIAKAAKGIAAIRKASFTFTEGDLQAQVEKIAIGDSFMHNGVKYYPVGENADSFFALGVKGNKLMKLAITQQYLNDEGHWDIKWKYTEYSLYKKESGYIGA